MKTFLIAAALLTSAASPAPSGRWHQSSDTTELVLESRVKLTPSGSWAGTSLGGSVGYGSMTATRVAVEPVQRRVARTMTLTIAPDGGFDWTIERHFADDAGCTRTVRQRKTGTATMAAGAIVFTVRAGEQVAHGCGSDATTPMPAGEERFAARIAGTTMMLEGSGGIRWQFLK